MKLLFKPFTIALGLVIAKVAKKVSNSVWQRVSKDPEPPKATARETTWIAVIGSAAIEGVALKVTRAAVNRAGAASVGYLTGYWPGEKKEEQEREAAKSAR